MMTAVTAPTADDVTLVDPSLHTKGDDHDVVMSPPTGDISYDGHNPTEKKNLLLSAPDWIHNLDVKVGEEATSIGDLQSCGFDEKSNSPAYYFFEMQNPGQGAQYLTAKAFSLRSAEEVTVEEAQYSLLMSRLLTQMTQKQQASLATIMFLTGNSKDKDLSIFQKTRPPASVDDFKQFYTTGKNAIIPNLPHAVVKTTTDGLHSYVGLKDVIANLLASDTPVEKFDFDAKLDFHKHDLPDPPTVSTTPAAYDLHLELSAEIDDAGFVLYVWIKEWRDDFDPSHTKSSRGQVWIDTYTIGEPTSEKSGKNTFFMAIGAKGDDHSDIEELFAKELESLSKEGGTFYHGGLKRLIRVKVGKILLCVDRPERAAIFRIGDHNGAFSLVWGMAARVDGLCDKY
jgi:hypothetical protein